MNLHVNIAYRFWFSFKGHPNYILVISKWPYMWVLRLRLGFVFWVLGLQLKLSKSPMGYIEMNLNMGITFRAKYSYNFALPTHVLIFTNYKFNKICNKTQKKICLLPFGNISKMNSFTYIYIYIYIYIHIYIDIALFYICLSLKNSAQNAL